MRWSTCALLLSTVLSVASCRGPASPDVQTQQPQIPTPSLLSPRQTPTSTSHSPTAIVARTSQPSATPPHTYGLAPPPGHPEGDTFAYIKQIGERNILVLVASDASRASAVELPPDIFFASDPIDGLSPDGHLFAFFTGDMGPWSNPPPPGSKQLYLNVMRLDDGSPVAILPLLSDRYPSDIAAIASNLEGNPPDGYQGATVDEIALGIYNAFQAGATSVAWAPDSSSLAYASQDPGPSSDLFLLDLASGTSRRLSSGQEMIEDISWSPDGEWIGHSSVMALAMGVNDSWHFARPDGSDVVSFEAAGSKAPGWISSDSFVVTDGANGIGTFDLKLLQPSARRLLRLWPHPYNDYAIDPLSSDLLISVLAGWEESTPASGTYFVRYPYSAPELLEAPVFDSLAYWGTSEYTFGGLTIDETIAAISPSRQILPIAETEAIQYLSPDAHYLALERYWSADPPGLVLLDLPSLQQLPVFAERVNRVFWSPDSLGFFFVADDELFHFDVRTFTTTLVDSFTGDHLVVSPKWVTAP